MKIKQLTLVILSCILSYGSIAQIMLDPLGIPTTEYFPESNLAPSTTTVASPANVVNVIPSPSSSLLELAFDGEYLWVVGYSADVIFKISPIDGSIIKTIPTPGIFFPGGLTFDGESLWIGNKNNQMLYQLDTLDGTVLSSFQSPANPNESYLTGLGWSGSDLWQNDTKTGQGTTTGDVIYNMNTDGTLIQEIDHLFAFPSGLTFEGEYLWCSDNVTDKLYKIDVNTFSIVDEIDAPGGDYPNGLTFDGEFLWVGNNDSDSIYQIAIVPSNNLSIQYQLQQPSCNDSENGSLSVSYTPVDTLLTFLWSTGATGSEISDVAAGDYGLTITNQDGDIVVDTLLSLTDPDPLLIGAFSVTNPTCNGSNAGGISLDVIGGTPNYTYLWNTGAVDSQINNLTAGDYSVTITDSNECTLSFLFTLTQPLPIEGTGFSTPETGNNMDGSAGFSEVTGGTEPYIYAWSTTPVQTTMVATGLPAGPYTVVITDANGCTSLAEFEVSMMTNVMEDLGITTFDVYPNPASEVAYVNLLFKDSKDWSLSVYQIDGRLVKEEKATNGISKSERVVLDDLASGEYVVTLLVDGKRVSRTLVVR